MIQRRNFLWMTAIVPLGVTMECRSGPTSAPRPQAVKKTDFIRGGYWMGPDVASIPASYYTHVYHAFLQADKNGKLPDPTPKASKKKSFFDVAKLFVSHCHKGGAKAMISLGGGSDKSFSSFLPSASKRRAYIHAVLDVVKTYGYDGIDLDWEFPRSEAEKKLWITLVGELRRGMDGLTKLNKKKYGLTAAVGVGKWATQFIDTTTIIAKLDFINLMAYDYFGSWGGLAGDHPSLEAPFPKGHSIHDTINFWRSRGIKPNQIVIGMPFYARVCFGYKPAEKVIPKSKNKDKIKRTASMGYDTFLAYAAKHKWTMRLNPKSKVRWYTSPDGKNFAAVDGPEAILAKTRFAEAKGYRGVFCWATYHNPGLALQKAMAKPQR